MQIIWSRFPNEKLYPVTGRELDTAWILLDDLLHLLPCRCQSDLKTRDKSLFKMLKCSNDIWCLQWSNAVSYIRNEMVTVVVSSSSCLKSSFFFLASASTCSLNSFSFSSRSNSDADSQRWSFLRLRRVSDHVASDDRTWNMYVFILSIGL